MLKKPNKILFLLILLALMLRLAGINHGFPFVFHPDEPTVVSSALGVRFNPNPGHFDWPHLYIYVNYVIYMIFAFLRDSLTSLNLKQAVSGILPIIWADEGNVIFTLLTRILSAVFGAFTLIPVYLAGKKMFNEKVALIAAFGYATFQMQVRNSHYTMPDTAMTFFAAWGMYYCVKILMEKDLANYVLAGFFFGLAASTKYNGALGLFLIPVAYLLAPVYSRFTSNYERKGISILDTFVAVVGCTFSTILGFVIGTPYSVLDYKTFIRTDGPAGALWQFTNVGKSIIFQRFDLVLERLLWKVGNEVSYVALISVLVLIIVIVSRIILRKFSKFDICLLFLLIPTIFLLIYIAGNEKSRSHYFMVLYPFMAILFGYFADLVFSLVRRKSEILSLAVLSIMLFPSFYASFTTAVSFYNNDTRLDLYAWSKNYLNGTESIGYDSDNLKLVSRKISQAARGVIDANSEGASDYFITGVNSVPASGYVEVLKIDGNFRVGPPITVYKRL